VRDYIVDYEVQLGGGGSMNPIYICLLSHADFGNDLRNK